MTAAPTVFMFSGQGSQYLQMGRPLFVQDRVFRQSMLRLDGLARELCGYSILETLYSDRHGKSDTFDRTELTHPAIFMVEYSLAQALLRANVVPDLTLGASLGAFAAAAVSGFISVEDAFAAVLRQAAIFADVCEPGGMLAVLADPALFQEAHLYRCSAMAGVNFSTHFVVSCQQARLEELEHELRGLKAAHQRLPVSRAFHSQWIDEARGAVESVTCALRRRTSRLAMWCCERNDFVTALPDDYFWRIARNPIRFQDAVTSLEARGPHRYIDVGPAGTLATFLKYGLSSASRSTVHPILTPYGQDLKNMAALMTSRAS